MSADVAIISVVTISNKQMDFYFKSSQISGLMLVFWKLLP